MIARLIDLFVRFRWLVLFIFAGIAALGVYNLLRLPIDAVPDITNNQVQINVRAPALSPELVEKQVSFPIETALLRAARAAGCRTLDGGGMAVFQAVEAFRLFTGTAPDAERMLRHFASMGGDAAA